PSDSVPTYAPRPGDQFFASRGVRPYLNFGSSSARASRAVKLSATCTSNSLEPGAISVEAHGVEECLLAPGGHTCEAAGDRKPTCVGGDRKTDLPALAHNVGRSPSRSPEGAELSLRCIPHLLALGLTAAHVG